MPRANYKCGSCGDSGEVPPDALGEDYDTCPECGTSGEMRVTIA